MIYNLTFDPSKLRVQNKIRGPAEIVFTDCILVDSSTPDYYNSIIYPERCQNFDRPENIPLSADFRHQKLDGAGYLTNLSLSIDKTQMLADFIIGEQHSLINKDGKVFGSSYASAWMTIAEYQASQDTSKTKTYKDFIPSDIFDKYFRGKTVLPITGLSVELDWVKDPEKINGVIHIRDYWIVRVTILIADKAGQPNSLFNVRNFKIRSMQEELQTIEANLADFESGNLLKIRSGGLSDAYLTYQAIEKVVKERTCAMCEAEAKKRNDEMMASNQVSMTELETSNQATVDELNATITEHQAKITELEARIAELELTTPADVEKTRMADTDKTFNLSNY